MRELVVILEDLFAPLPLTGLAPPRLPALETLLRRARREALRQDWRSWLATRTGAAALAPRAPAAPAELTPAELTSAEFAPAALLAHAWGLERGASGRAGTASSERRGWWLATPVHMIAGIDRVLLHPAGVLQLPAGEQQQLAQQFAQVFAGSVWQLHARDARELLLAGPLLAASGRDPVRFLGTDPAAGLPAGPDAAPLRALGSELELWLHEHPLNRERAARGVLPVTTLWLWGGPAAAGPIRALPEPTTTQPGPGMAQPGSTTASAVPAPTEGAPLYLYGGDTCAAALVRMLGGQCRPLPAALAGIVPLEEAARGVVLYPLRAEDGDQDRLERLEQLERLWLAPALSALRAGSLARLLLVATDHVYHLDRPRWWRAWRMRRARTAWWEVLGGTGSDAP